jgi:hypothetical protein
MKTKDHAEVRERIQPSHCVNLESFAVEPDDGFDRAPLIVDCIGATSNDDANRLQGDHDDSS